MKQLEHAIDLKPEDPDHQRPSRRCLLARRPHARSQVPVGARARPQARPGRSAEDRGQARKRAAGRDLVAGQGDKKTKKGRRRRLRSRPRLLSAALSEQAPAKINLTLRVLGRRADGYHELESLVAFADLADTLSFAAGRRDDARRVRAVRRGLRAARRQSGAQGGERAARARRRAAEPGAFVLDEKYSGRRRPRRRLGRCGGGAAPARASQRSAADDRAARRGRARASAPTCRFASIRAPRIMRGVGELFSAPLDLAAARRGAGQSARAACDARRVRRVLAGAAVQAPEPLGDVPREPRR